MSKYSTSQKHRNFISEPIGNKSVKALPGIGDVLGGRLITLGYDKAYVVFGQFCFLRGKKRRFRRWLKKACNANAKQQRDCYRGLKEWSESFVF